MVAALTDDIKYWCTECRDSDEHKFTIPVVHKRGAAAAASAAEAAPVPAVAAAAADVATPPAPALAPGSPPTAAAAPVAAPPAAPVAASPTPTAPAPAHSQPATTNTSTSAADGSIATSQPAPQPPTEPALQLTQVGVNAGPSRALPASPVQVTSESRPTDSLVGLTATTTNAAASVDGTDQSPQSATTTSSTTSSIAAKGPWFRLPQRVAQPFAAAAAEGAVVMAAAFTPKLHKGECAVAPQVRDTMY